MMRRSLDDFPPPSEMPSSNDESLTQSSTSNNSTRSGIENKPANEKTIKDIELWDYIESCPKCHKIGIRKGHLPDRGGGPSQRYKCAVHGYYFFPDLVTRNKKKTLQKINYLLYGGGSYESRANELGVSRQTLLRPMRKAREDCMGGVEIAKEFKPDWSDGSRGGRTVVLDATRLRKRALRASSFVNYVSFDEESGDPICYTVDRDENEFGWLLHFQQMDRTGLKAKMIISDKGPAGCLRRAVARHYPGTPHQLDWKHEIDEIEDIIPPPPCGRRRRNRDYQNEREQCLYRLIIKLRDSRDLEHFNKIFEKILELRPTMTSRGQQVIRLLQDDYDGLSARYNIGVNVSTSNTAESAFSRFKQFFLKAKKGFHACSRSQAEKAVNLFWAAYRSKPLQNSTDPRKRGRTTLQLANANIRKNDIWQFMRPKH